MHGMNIKQLIGTFSVKEDSVANVKMRHIRRIYFAGITVII
jgi:hypothetical protein